VKISVNFEAQFHLNYMQNFGFHLTKDTPCVHYHDEAINDVYCNSQTKYIRPRKSMQNLLMLVTVGQYCRHCAWKRWSLTFIYLLPVGCETVFSNWYKFYVGHFKTIYIYIYIYHRYKVKERE